MACNRAHIGDLMEEGVRRGRKTVRDEGRDQSLGMRVPMGRRERKRRRERERGNEKGR